MTFVFADALQIDGVTLRLTADRRPALSYPQRTSGAGKRHALVRPIDDQARRAVEAEVFAALGIDPEGGLDAR